LLTALHEVSVVKFLCSMLFVLALCACNAFDEERLASLRSDFSQAPQADAGAQPPGDVTSGSDAAPTQRDSSDIDDDGPELRSDAGALQGGNRAPELPEGTLCGDEDAGVTSDIDSDEDGAPDCVDLCPVDPGKDSPGLCGCGHPDTEDTGEASCTTLRSALLHRFRFDGTGTTLPDERGTADGKVMNATLLGQGSLELAGGASDQYVDLPNGMISSHTNVTIEAWVTWNGGGGWQRVFDFGDSDSGMEGVNGFGATYLMLSPLINDRSFGAAYANDGPDSAVFVESAESLTIGVRAHVALVFDDANDQMKLYLNGRFVGGAVVTGSLSAITDRNNWLGRSQYRSDEGFAGSLHELRIYDRALSPAQLELSFAYGTDPSFLSD
jgi:hypothetical protein